MAIRDLPNTDGLPACEVDTAEELTQRLVPGVSRAVRSRRFNFQQSVGHPPSVIVPIFIP